jgi:Bifunctional DNA primase/polymerase, N-terminal
MADNASTGPKSKSPKSTISGLTSDQAKIAERRLKLVKAGFLPIPTREKKTWLDGWADITAVTEEMIITWAKEHDNHPSDGLLAKDTPGLDIDIKNKVASEAAEAMVRGRFGPNGRILVRTGMAPKRLIPFRTDRPFDKITRNLDAPDGSKGQKIEFLASRQMYLIFGDHPDTRRPYTWVGGEPGEVACDELPKITEAEAIALCDDLAQMLIRDFGYSWPEGTEGQGGGGGRDWDELIANVRSGAELHDSIRDLAAKLVGHKKSARTPASGS